MLVDVHRRYVVDAGSTFVFPSRELADEVLLGVAGDLSRSSRDHEISGDVPPIPLSILLKPHQEQSVEKIIQKWCQNT